MPAANDLRKGQAIKYNNDTYIVLEVHHCIIRKRKEIIFT